MPKDKIIVLSGRTVAKLENGVKILRELGYTVYAKTFDASNRESVKALVEFALQFGEVKNVIHTAGSSAQTKGTIESILRINALGTMYINQEFSKVMKSGGAIVDVASASAYLVPALLIPKKAFALAEEDESLFLEKMTKRCVLARSEEQKKTFANALSKNFVVWYAKKSAFEYGVKGIRVVSVSPGLIAADTDASAKQDGDSLIDFSAEGRMGKAKELGYALATIADERNGYLTGVDILCDGGSISGMKEFKKKTK